MLKNLLFSLVGLLVLERIIRTAYQPVHVHTQAATRQTVQIEAYNTSICNGNVITATKPGATVICGEVFTYGQ